MSKEKSVRFGVIGIGGMGGGHARNVLSGKVPGLELAAVADINPETAKLFPDTTFFDSGSAMIASGAIDAVLVATPHYDHTTLGIEALEAGLHLLVEKPISVHKADAERLIAAHKSDKQVFAAMFNQRTDPRYIKLKKLIEDGELGKLFRVQWTITDWYRTELYYASGGWRATWAGEGGGVLLNQCPHQLDLWQWLFGMPEEVRAFCQIARYHDIEVEDDVTAYMRYADGMTGVFITTTGEAPGTNRLEIAADRGRVVIEGDSISWIRSEELVAENLKTSPERFKKPATWKVEIPVDGSGEQHVGVLKNFAKAILDGEPLIAPAAEGIRSVELANAMLYSSFEERSMMLPIDGAGYESLLKKKIESSTYVKKTVEAETNDLSGSF